MEKKTTFTLGLSSNIEPEGKNNIVISFICRS